MKFKYLQVFLITFFLSGCAANSAPKMSSEKGQKLVTEFQTENFDWTSPARVTSWLQPDNKEESCKIFIGTDASNKSERPFWEKEDISIFWDGECKDGYAYGIGREFMESVGSGLISSLASYDEPGIKPSLYYTAKYDDHQYSYFLETSKSESEDIIFSQEFVVFNNGTNNFSLGKSTSVFDKENNINYESHEYLFTGRTTYFINFSTNKSIKLEGSIYLADAIRWRTTLARGADPAVVVIKYKNDAVQMFEYEDQVRKATQLPENLTSFFQHEVTTGISNLQRVDTLLQPSKRAMSIYKRRVCQGEVSVDFMDDTLYGQICLPDGDLSRYSDQIAKYEKTWKESWARAEEGQKKRERQAIQNRKIATQQAKKDANAMAQSLSDFGKSVSQFNQNATTLHQSAVNQSVPTVNFGGNDVVTTNCVRISNVVNCRSR